MHLPDGVVIGPTMLLNTVFHVYYSTILFAYILIADKILNLRETIVNMNLTYRNSTVVLYIRV